MIFILLLAKDKEEAEHVIMFMNPISMIAMVRAYWELSRAKIMAQSMACHVGEGGRGGGDGGEQVDV
jgi:hypothetical protein